MAEIPDTGGFPKSRIEMLVDGICAIVMTLLVLELMGGAIAEAHDEPAVSEALGALWPKAVSNVISFVMASILWVPHHSQFHWVRRTDRRHIWLNLFFLLSLSLLPFSAALLGAHPEIRPAVLAYGANVILAGGALLAQWRYALHAGLLATDCPVGLDHAVTRRMVIGQLTYWPAMGVAFVSPIASFWLYVVLAVGFVALQISPESRN